MEDKLHKLNKAVDELLHLNECEKEGILSGMPSPAQWEDAFETLEKARLSIQLENLPTDKKE